jgi:hypothetical protein
MSMTEKDQKKVSNERWNYLYAALVGLLILKITIFYILTKTLQ